jgi:hypothetical protein
MSTPDMTVTMPRPKADISLVNSTGHIMYQ